MKSPKLVKKSQQDLYFLCDNIDEPDLLESFTLITQDRSKAEDLKKKAKKVITLVDKSAPIRKPNICKVNLKNDTASAMVYDNLKKPHPELITTYPFMFFDDDPDPQSKPKRDERSENPLIFHRLDLLLQPGSELHNFHRKIAEYEEQGGVFDQDNLRIIGRKQGLLTVLRQKKLNENLITNPTDIDLEN